MNKIGQPPLACDMAPLSGAWRKHWRRPSAGRGPGAPRPCSWPRPRLTLASRMRRTTAEQKPASQGTVWWPQWALASPSQKRGALVLCFHMRALEFGLAWGRGRVLWARFGLYGFCLLTCRQVAAHLPPPRIQCPARGASVFRLKCPHTSIVPRAECI